MVECGASRNLSKQQLATLAEGLYLGNSIEGKNNG